MSLYNRKYVHFEWEPSLLDKKGFVADTIAALKNLIDNKGVIALVELKRSNSKDFHFTYNDSGQVYQFCYYDPDYECKAAYVENKTIQYFDDSERQWVDYVGTMEPDWSDALWRVKPADEHWYVSYNIHGFTRSNRRDTFENEILYEGTSDECYDYTKAHLDLQPILKDYAEGRPLQYFLNGRWEDLEGKKLAGLIGTALFRPKPKDDGPVLSWTDLKVGDVIKHKKDPIRAMIIGTSEEAVGSGKYHVCSAIRGWLTDEDLKDWEKVL